MTMNNWNLSTKIVVAFSTLVSLGLGSLSLAQYWQLRTSQRKAMADRLSEIVQLAAPQIDGDYHSLVIAAQDASSTYYRINQTQLGKIQAASDDIQRIYTVRQQADDHYAYVLDYQPDSDSPETIVGGVLENPPSLLAAKQTIDSPTVESRIVNNGMDIPVLTGYAPILNQFDRLDGLLVVELDARPILAREQQAQMTALAALALILIAVVGTVRYLAQVLVVRPTLSLNQAAKRLAEGEWTATLPTARKDEFGELARSFSHMAQRLQRSFKQLEDYSQNLEEKVKARTQALSESQQLLNLVMNNIPQSIFWKRKDSVYLGCNQSFAETAGITVEEIVGKTDGDLPWATEEADFFVGGDRAVIESGIANIGAVESRTQANGQQSWLEMSKVPLYDADKAVMGLIGIFQDITPYKEAEQAAQQASKTKSEFLANMNHELRTPLNGILGYAQIIQRDLDAGSKHQKGLSTIYQCASHLLSLINDILDFSKLDVQKMTLSPQEFHLRDFLNSTVDMCRIKASQKGVALCYEADSNLPIAVDADDKRLRQVLINLLGNAAKFTDDGKVTFRVKTVQSSNDGDLWRLRFEIEDTGIGIEKSKLEKIFSPFEQAGDRDHNAEGTGLGLAISRRIVQLMGGDIQVDSELGKGSTFWFEVDLADAHWANRYELAPDSSALSSVSQGSVSQDSDFQDSGFQNSDSQMPVSNNSPISNFEVPPASELSALYAAAKDGFMADVQQEAMRLKALDQRYVPFADKLIALSNQFNDSAIVDLIRPAMQEVAIS